MKLKRLFAMLMAALFILNSAVPLFDISYAAASHDYREWPFAGVNKPTAQFKITNKRTGESVTSPDNETLSSNFPKINAQVGDVIEFTDMSKPGSGSRISGHDFQWREGSGKFNVQSGMKSNIEVKSEGTWSFYLGVKDNASVPSPWSNWSENGNHRWISENIHNTGYDMYWYFTAVSVEVGPKDPPQAEFEIRYDGRNVTDNQSNPISLESLPYQVSLIDKSTSASSSITQWEWKTWQGGAWQQFSTSKNPTFNVDSTIKGFMLTVWDANGAKSEWVKHDVYADVDGAPPPEEPEGDIWVRIDVPDEIEEGKNFNVRQTHDSTHDVVNIVWYENGERRATEDGNFDGYRRSITRDRTFGVEITDSKGNTAYDEKTVRTVEKVPDYISANLWFELVTPEQIELTVDDILEDKEFEISVWLTGEGSSTNNGYVRDYWYWINKATDELPPQGSEESADHHTSLSRTEYEEKQYYSAVRTTFVVKPSDPMMMASLRVGNNSSSTMYDETTAYQAYNFVYPATDPPITHLSLPDTFYPEEVTQSTSIKNTITWDYDSPDNIPYKHSEVSLYKIEGNTKTPVFENRIQEDREINVEGNAEEVYEIEVAVVDQFNIKSSTRREEFKYITVSPEINLEIDVSKEREDLLGVIVANNTPDEIETLFPTTYTGWEIWNTNGELILDGEGEIPRWIDITEPFYGNVATIIQKAENTLGNKAQALDRYFNSSKIDFEIDPNRLFETQMAKIIDHSRAISNHRWSIRDIFNENQEYIHLILNENKEFTKNYGEYQVRLEAKGRSVEESSLYKYSNSRELLEGEPITPTALELLELHESGAEYVYLSAEWDGRVGEGPYEYKGEEYQFRRSLRYMVITSNNDLTGYVEVEFRDTKPTAHISIDGNRKQYKKIILNGSGSISATDSELQEAFPIIFEHELTIFQVIPLNEEGEIEVAKNIFINGIGKEIVDDVVTFKGKEVQELRIDTSGEFKFRYKVYNGKKESDWVETIVYIAPELPLIISDVEVAENEVYRDVNDDLRAKLEVTVTYDSPDDEIDELNSLFYVEYNEDGIFSEEVNPTYWIKKNGHILPSYLKMGDIQYGEKDVKLTMYVDNPTKNKFGHFRFNFIGIEKPIIPNFENTLFPDIPIIKDDSFPIADEKKVIFVDNYKPIIYLNSNRENTVELWVIEETGRTIVDANGKLVDSMVISVVEQLKLNRVNTTVYVIQANGVHVVEY